MSPTPSDTSAFMVAGFEPNRWLLWHQPLSTWSRTLTGLPGGHSRPVTRLRIPLDWHHLAISLFSVVLNEFGNFPMMRRMLLGIRDRAEVGQRGSCDKRVLAQRRPDCTTLPTPHRHLANPARSAAAMAAPGWLAVVEALAATAWTQGAEPGLSGEVTGDGLRSQGRQSLPWDGGMLVSQPAHAAAFIADNHWIIAAACSRVGSGGVVGARQRVGSFHGRLAITGQTDGVGVG